MDVDPVPVPGMVSVGAEAAIAAARRTLAQGSAQVSLLPKTTATTAAATTATTIDPCSHQSTTCDTKNQVNNPADPGGLFKQCSNAKLANNFVNMTSFSTGTGTTYEPVPVPRIGNIIVEGETDLSKLYHGARLMKNGKLTNDVLTSTFDPTTLHCLACTDRHHVINNEHPVAVVVSDQNFLPALSSDLKDMGGCISVTRLEDASLSDIADLTVEIFDKTTIPAGTVFLIGSASHLFRVGVAAYAQDWITVSNNLAKKFKNIHVCPLVPLILEDTPGSLARDIEMLAMWLHKLYGTGIKGLNEVWTGAASYATQYSLGGTGLQYDDVLKISLPSSLDSPGAETFFFKFNSSCPVRLLKMDRKVQYELLSVLVHLLKNNFSVTVCPEVILPRAPPTIEDPAAIKNLICVGSSIIKQTIPYLRALGFCVTDLSKPGWLATQENIQALISELSALTIPAGFSLVLDLLGNWRTDSNNLMGRMHCRTKKGANFT
jgi:hypothetical protein